MRGEVGTVATVIGMKGRTAMRTRILEAALAALALSGCATTHQGRPVQANPPQVVTRPMTGTPTPVPGEQAQTTRPAANPEQSAESTAVPPVGSAPTSPAQTTQPTQSPTASPNPQTTLPGQAKPVSALQKTFGEGIAAFDAGKLDEAEKKFKAVLERSPGQVNAQYNLGVIAERRGDLAAAQKAYEQAQELEPRHHNSLINLGKVYRLRGAPEKAVTLFEHALKAPGMDSDVFLLNQLAASYRLVKDYPKAEATARRALAQDPKNAEAYKTLALVYYDQGNYRLAEFVSGNARKLSEKDPGIYNNLGLIYLKMNDRPRALAQFHKAVELDPQFAPGYLNVGVMALAHRDYVNAEKAFAKVIAIDPENVEGRLDYAYALEGQKARDPQKAIAAGEAFEKVVAMRGESGELICAAAWSYAQDKTGWDRAVPLLEKCKTQGDEKSAQLVDAKLKTIAAMKAAGQLKPAATTNPKDATVQKAPIQDGKPATSEPSAQSANADGTPAEDGSENPDAQGDAKKPTANAGAMNGPDAAKPENTTGTATGGATQQANGAQTNAAQTNAAQTNGAQTNAAQANAAQTTAQHANSAQPTARVADVSATNSMPRSKAAGDSASSATGGSGMTPGSSGASAQNRPRPTERTPEPAGKSPSIPDQASPASRPVAQDTAAGASAQPATPAASDKASGQGQTNGPAAPGTPTDATGAQ